MGKHPLERPWGFWRPHRWGRPRCFSPHRKSLQRRCHHWHPLDRGLPNPGASDGLSLLTEKILTPCTVFSSVLPASSLLNLFPKEKQLCRGVLCVCVPLHNFWVHWWIRHKGQESSNVMTLGGLLKIAFKQKRKACQQAFTEQPANPFSLVVALLPMACKISLYLTFFRLKGSRYFSSKCLGYLFSAIWPWYVWE